MFDDYSCSYSVIAITLTVFFCYSLLDYFSQHLGEYLNVLSALESLNIAILKAMDKTKEVRIHQSTWRLWKLYYEPFSFMWICLNFGRPHGHHSLALNSTDYWNDCTILTLEVGLHTDFVLESWQVGCSLKCNTCTMQVIARKTQGWKQFIFINSDDSHWLTSPVVSLSLVPLWKIPPNPETQKCWMSRLTLTKFYVTRLGHFDGVYPISY